MPASLSHADVTALIHSLGGRGGSGRGGVSEGRRRGGRGDGGDVGEVNGHLGQPHARADLGGDGFGARVGRQTQALEHGVLELDAARAGVAQVFVLGAQDVVVEAARLVDAADRLGGDVEAARAAQNLGLERLDLHVRAPRAARLHLGVRATVAEHNVL